MIFLKSSGSFLLEIRSFAREVSLKVNLDKPEEKVERLEKLRMFIGWNKSEGH